jgi:PKD repeat protein
LFRQRSIPALVSFALLAALVPLTALPAAAQSPGGLAAMMTADPATVAVNQDVHITYTVPPSPTSTSSPGLTTSAIDFGDGTTVDGGSVGPGQTISGEIVHAYANPGTYTITLSAQAPDGETGSATATVTVVSQLQSPAVQLQGPTSGIQPGDSASFTYSVTPSSGASITTIAIDYGDGSADTLSAPSGTVSHVYSSAGAYAVLIVTTDSNGQTGAASTVVRVGS